MFFFSALIRIDTVGQCLNYMYIIHMNTIAAVNTLKSINSSK